MIAMLLKALSDSLLSALFNFIQAELQKRALVAQGRADQHIADLSATVQEAKHAAKIQEDVARLDDAGLDAGLERVRDNAAPGHH